CGGKLNLLGTLTMQLRYLLSAAMLGIWLVGCGNNASDAAISSVQANADALQAHLEFLASDDLEGRDTGSRGHEIASLYIAAEFKKLGLQPAGDNGTYFQRVKFRSSTLKENSATFSVQN